MNLISSLNFKNLSLTIIIFIFSACNYLESYIVSKDSASSITPETSYSFTITPIFPTSLSSATGEASSQMNVVVQVTADVVTTALTAAAVYQVYINDTLATLKIGTTDFYEATIPIASGNVQITVDVRKNSQSVKSSNAQVTNRSMNPFADSVYGIGLSPDKTKAYVVGWNKELMEVVLATGERRVVTNFTKGIGSGPNVVDLIQAVAINNAGTMAYVGGNTFGIMSIDLITGERAIHSKSGDRGTGQPVYWPNGIVLDSTNTYMYVVEAFGRHMTRIEVATGNRTTFSSDGSWFGAVGAGPAIGLCRGAVLSADEQTLYTFNMSNFSVMAINIATGNRSVVSIGGGLPIGTGPDLTTNSGLQGINTVTNELYIYSWNKIFKVDIATGNRTLLSSSLDQIASGVGFEGLNGMASDPTGGFLYPIDYAGEIFKVEISTGNRTLVKELSIGSGPDILNIGNAHANSTNDKVYFSTTEAIYSVIPSTGERSLISNSSRGTGANLKNIVAMALNSTSTSVYVLDRATSTVAAPNALVKIDLSTGNRTVVSSASVGTGVNIVTDQSMTLSVDAIETYAYISNWSTDEITQIEIASGNRWVVSSSVVGTGTNMSYVTDTLVSPDGHTLYVSDSPLGTLFAINLATGNRTVLSSASVGTGMSLAGISFLVPGFENGVIYASVFGKIVQIDLANGNRTVVIDGSLGNGYKVAGFSKFNKMLPNQKFYAPLGGGMGEFDIVSGARVIFSR